MHIKIASNINEILELSCRPILKWAGGKSQMLGELLPRVPQKYGRFIEPFLGGGALFFYLRPEQAIIADSNPELINLYRTIANNAEGVIACLKLLKNEEDAFYSERAQDWTKLSPEKAAARTIYLNRTCFNGLYRVNKTVEGLMSRLDITRIRVFSMKKISRPLLPCCTGQQLSWVITKDRIKETCQS